MWSNRCAKLTNVFVMTAHVSRPIFNTLTRFFEPIHQIPLAQKLGHEEAEFKAKKADFVGVG